MLNNVTFGADASSCAKRIDSDVPGPSLRTECMDRVLHTEEECAERKERAKNTQSFFAEISATSQKFNLLDVSMASDDNNDRCTSS